MLDRLADDRNSPGENMRGADETHELASIKAMLIEKCAAHFGESGRHWLEDSMQALGASEQLGEDLGFYSAMARRKLGARSAPQSGAIDTRHARVGIGRWSSAECARLMLLISAVESRPAQAEELVAGYYRMGDESERMALLRGLIFFAPADYLSEIALDAGRTNNLDVLAAISLDNPYPACFYSDDQFNQMVLKALFLGLAIERVQGLADRANPELARMGEQYVVEREAAGRAVPVDIWLAIGPCASDNGRRQMLDYLDHAEIGHRYYCSQSLLQRLPRDPQLLPILRQRLDNERETPILELLRDVLET